MTDGNMNPDGIEISGGLFSRTGEDRFRFSRRIVEDLDIGESAVFPDPAAEGF